MRERIPIGSLRYDIWRKYRYFLALTVFLAAGFYMAGAVFSLPLPEVHNVTGNDISFPQCGKDFPKGQAFGVVGVNGGVATRTNPCLSEQLRWAAGSSGIGVGQLRVQLYVNTGNPYDPTAPSWPRDHVDPLGNPTRNPHGRCDGTASHACAWQYGWNRSVEAVHFRFKPAARAAHMVQNPRTYRWWLDVETMNSWQEGSPEALASNRAVLEAMAAFYQYNKLHLGIYSTSYQLGKIVGELPSDSRLHGIDTWLAGGEDAEYAATKCNDPPLTRGGRVVMVQYIRDNFDFNYSCL
ncbi:hypothetical protein JNJ66_00725 [Candidatus Saccharibacteria bacterium]|nr:hypothetical protein [Candidatus Saccharibacteria bacterium]